MKPCLSFLSSVSLVVSLFTISTPSEACGPDFSEPVFVSHVRPESFSDFAQGQIGIVQSDWNRSVLMAAYLGLADSTLTDHEQQALVRNWQEEFERKDVNNTVKDAAINAWLAARKGVLPNAPEPKIYAFRNIPESYNAFLNCTANAFTNAITTLNARIASYPDDAHLKDWVNSQDQVFALCNEGSNLPPVAAADAPDWLKYDRDYQRASAHFYAMQYDDAKQDYAKIAQTENSPWHDLATYLLARVAIRQGKLSDAEVRLSAILANPKLSAYHASARQLTHFVQFRTQPEVLHNTLAQQLLSPDNDENFYQDVVDYRSLLDEAETDEGATQTLQKTFRQASELTDWIFTLQSDQADAANHALARWQSTQKPVWLIAALTKTPGNSSDADALTSAGLAIKSDAASYTSATYYSARLLIAQHKPDEARKILDSLLRNDKVPINLSSRNQLFSLRLLLAQNQDEFVHFAQRRASAFEFSSVTERVDLSQPVEAEDYYAQERLWLKRAMFDGDATRIMNLYMPLSVLKKIALHPELPDYLKRLVVMSVWTRAILLNDEQTAVEFVPFVVQYLPEIKDAISKYKIAKSKQERFFEAIWLMLKNPAMRPVVTQGSSRLSAFNEIDHFRDNWWYDTDFDRANRETSVPAFLTANELAQATSENAEIAALTGGANYLARQTVAWVNYNPKEKRLAEALHLGVKATRYGCQNCNTAQASKAAFDELKNRFKNSPWQKKTPYWFGEACAVK